MTSGVFAQSQFAADNFYPPNAPARHNHQAILDELCLQEEAYQATKMVRLDGLEPSTFSLSERRSNQLSYKRVNLHEFTNYNLQVILLKKKKLSNLATTYSPSFKKQVPSAMKRFTLEFGMGSCGSTSL